MFDPFWRRFPGRTRTRVSVGQTTFAASGEQCVVDVQVVVGFAARECSARCDPPAAYRVAELRLFPFLDSGGEIRERFSQHFLHHLPHFLFWVERVHRPVDDLSVQKGTLALPRRARRTICWRGRSRRRVRSAFCAHTLVEECVGVGCVLVVGVFCEQFVGSSPDRTTLIPARRMALASRYMGTLARMVVMS